VIKVLKFIFKTKSMPKLELYPNATAKKLFDNPQEIRHLKLPKPSSNLVEVT